MPLEIKVGHRYRTRSGDVVEITGNDGHYIWPFVGVNKNGEITSFAKDGTWSIGEESQKDLIEELPADTPA